MILFRDSNGQPVHESTANQQDRERPPRAAARVERIREALTRKREELAALPAPLLRSAAERRQAADLSDWILLARCVLDVAAAGDGGDD